MRIKQERVLMGVRIRQTNPNAIDKVVDRYKKNYAIAVGFPASTKSIEYPDGTSVVEVAITNNFGSTSKRVPARPFMSKAKPEVIKKIKAPLKKMTHQLNEKLTTKKKMADTLGVVVEAVFKKAIIDLRIPPNAPSTIARKGSHNPLVNTQLMVQSLRSETREIRK